MWSQGEPPVVKSWCVSRPSSLLVAWHMAPICLPECRKKESGACFKHIWSVFIFNNSQWVFMCLSLPMEAEFLTCSLVFLQFYTQLLKSRMKNSGRISKHNQPGRKFYLYSLGDGQWLKQFIWKLILKLEEFQYHLWHRFMSPPHFEKGTKLYSFRCKK